MNVRTDLDSNGLRPRSVPALELLIAERRDELGQPPSKKLTYDLALCAEWALRNPGMKNRNAIAERLGKSRGRIDVYYSELYSLGVLKRQNPKKDEGARLSFEILAYIEENAPVTYQDIAARMGCSANAIFRHVQKSKEEGKVSIFVIKNCKTHNYAFSELFDPEKLGPSRSLITPNSDEGLKRLGDLILSAARVDEESWLIEGVRRAMARCLENSGIPQKVIEAVSLEWNRRALEEAPI